jgi:hypothetical protein
VEATSEEVHSLAFQSDEFGPAEASVCGDVDPCFVTVGYGFGEACDFVGVDESHGSFVGAGERYAFGWVDADAAAAYCGFEDHGEELVDLSYSAGGEAGVGEVGDECFDVEVVDCAERCGSEAGRR